jgi:hypothetical protein
VLVFLRFPSLIACSLSESLTKALQNRPRIRCAWGKLLETSNEDREAAKQERYKHDRPVADFLVGLGCRE